VLLHRVHLTFRVRPPWRDITRHGADRVPDAFDDYIGFFHHIQFAPIKSGALAILRWQKKVLKQQPIQWKTSS
jgi:hypothetical protein